MGKKECPVKGVTLHLNQESLDTLFELIDDAIIALEYTDKHTDEELNDSSDWDKYEEMCGARYDKVYIEKVRALKKILF